jgi:hypothetical protein
MSTQPINLSAGLVLRSSSAGDGIDLSSGLVPAQLGGAGGSWTPDQPKEPGILDTANEYYGAPAKPGEGLLHRLYRSAGRTAMIAPNLANALASPVTDPTTDEERQAHGVGGVMTAIINRLGLPITHLVDEPARAEAQKASADWKQPGILPKISAAGHELAGAIPFVGPAAASIGERIGSGDIAGGAADLGTMAALPKFIKEASPGGRLPGAPATGELALPATRAIADTTGKAMQAVRGTISPETMTAEQAATKAFRPRNSKTNWQKEVQSSLPDARRAANNLGIDVNQMTLDDALKATSQAKKEVWGEYRDNFMEPNKEATVDTTPVAAKIRQTLSDRQIEQQPGRSNKVWSTADSYSNREMPLQEIEDRVRELNNETRAIEARYLTDKRAAKLSPANSAKFAERDGLRQLLLSKLDEMSGPGAAELRKRYGALNSLEDVVSRRIPVAQRAAPNSLPSVLAKAYAAGKVARGVFTFNPADILEGGVSLLSQRKSAMLNDPDYLTQLAFRKTQARPPATIRGQVVQPPPSPLTGIAGMLPRGAYEQPAGNPPPEPLQLEHMQPVGMQMYLYRWNRMDRKNQLCKVLVRGKQNSCLVEFLDGFKAVTSRNALRKAVSAGRSIKPETLDTIGSMRDDLGDQATLRDVLREHGKDIMGMLIKDGALTERERPQMIDTTTGGLSEEGKKFAERALLGSVVDDPVLMEKTPKSVLDKVGGSLGELASLGAREDEWNIIPLVREALADHAEMASSGQNMATYLNQPRMFGAQRSQAVEAVVRTLGAKPKAAKQALRDFADAAHANQPGQQSLGLMKLPTASEAFNEAFRADISDADLMDAIRDSMARETPHDVPRFNQKTK